MELENESKILPDDLTDKEWDDIEPLLTRSAYRGAGAKPVHPRREMLNAIFYLLRTGCAWRHLPHDFPAWDAVYAQFRRWKMSGFLQKSTTICEGLCAYCLRRPKKLRQE